MAPGPQRIRVEVVLALPERQELVALELDAGSSLADAIARSRILERFEGFELDPDRVGVFGRTFPLEQVLRDGDRVEIYRPLIADPKEERRRRAARHAKP